MIDLSEESRNVYRRCIETLSSSNRALSAELKKCQDQLAAARKVVADDWGYGDLKDKIKQALKEGE